MANSISKALKSRRSSISCMADINLLRNLGTELPKFLKLFLKIIIVLLSLLDPLVMVSVWFDVSS